MCMSDYSLINKVVKVEDTKEGINYLDLVCFMYPNYELRTEFNILDGNRDIIFVGKVNSSVVSSLKENPQFGQN